ncbi:MAG: hypothetical protein WC284_09630 [Candidimonas sp.]
MLTKKQQTTINELHERANTLGLTQQWPFMIGKFIIEKNFSVIQYNHGNRRYVVYRDRHGWLIDGPWVDEFDRTVNHYKTKLEETIKEEITKIDQMIPEEIKHLEFLKSDMSEDKLRKLQATWNGQWTQITVKCRDVQSQAGTGQIKFQLQRPSDGEFFHQWFLSTYSPKEMIGGRNYRGEIRIDNIRIMEVQMKSIDGMEVTMSLTPSSAIFAA